MAEAGSTQDARVKWWWRIGRLDAGLRFSLLSILYMLVFYSIIYHQYADGTPGHTLLRSYLEMTARSSAWVLRWWGEQVTVSQATVRGRFAYQVILDCGALDVAALYCSAVLAFDSRITRKVAGVVLGMGAIWLFNLGRLVALYYAGAQSQSLFHLLHEEVMVLALVLFVCGIFLIWATWARRGVAPDRSDKTRLGLGWEWFMKLNTPHRRDLAVNVYIAALLFGIASWPFDNVRVGFSRTMSGVANVALENMHFNRGLQARLEPMPAVTERRASDNVQADTTLVLRLPQYSRPAQYGMSLRRDVYLPTVTFFVLMALVPLKSWQKAAGIAIGLLGIVAVTIFSIHVLISHTMNQLFASTTPDDLSLKMVTFLFDRWLLPWSNRVIAPLLLAGGLFLAFRGPRPKTLSEKVEVGAS